MTKDDTNRYQERPHRLAINHCRSKRSVYYEKIKLLFFDTEKYKFGCCVSSFRISRHQIIVKAKI